ncbi:transcription initiation factor TFIID subunit 1 [Trichonephila inaurata madagascariensis]|uniref:Transcription initiation factor TFIID subunit 1 n=1 Tax=Trichonephila inaurata madagascariensis TaxID=2747483 RepID=A0A8X7BQL4_9ARAC|nr:transcription initiation factor TFIID subunit 1 [Trichonephila inaurata madagascariensis]
MFDFLIFIVLQYEQQLALLETAIKASQEAALDAIETDSAMTGNSCLQEDSFIESEPGEKFEDHFREKVKVNDDLEFIDVEGEEDEFDEDEDDESILLDPNLLGKSDSAFSDKIQYDSDNEMQQITSLGTDGADIVQFDLSLCNDNENSEIIDENYDPSEFLLQGRYGFQHCKDGNEDNVSNDLLVSDSDEESARTIHTHTGQTEPENDGLWF